MNRRNFLGTLGILAVGGKLAAQEPLAPRPGKVILECGGPDGTFVYPLFEKIAPDRQELTLIQWRKRRPKGKFAWSEWPRRPQDAQLD